MVFLIYIYYIYAQYIEASILEGISQWPAIFEYRRGTLQSCLKTLEVVLSLDQDEQAENIGQFGCQMVVTVWV